MELCGVLYILSSMRDPCFSLLWMKIKYREVDHPKMRNKFRPSEKSVLLKKGSRQHRNFLVTPQDRPDLRALFIKILEFS